MDPCKLLDDHYTCVDLPESPTCWRFRSLTLSFQLVSLGVCCCRGREFSRLTWVSFIGEPMKVSETVNSTPIGNLHAPSASSLRSLDFGYLYHNLRIIVIRAMGPLVLVNQAPLPQQRIRQLGPSNKGSPFTMTMASQKLDLYDVDATNCQYRTKS